MFLVSGFILLKEVFFEFYVSKTIVGISKVFS